MSEPTLFTKGKLIAHDFSEAQGSLDKFRPIDYIMDWFAKRIDRAGSIKDRIMILQSSTGSGKSTVIPPEFYHRFFESTHRRNICCTQPRVLTSQDIPKTIVPFHTASVFAKNSSSMGRKPLKMGDNIGYQNGVVAKRPTRGIIFMTIGVLKQQLAIMTPEEFMIKYSIIIIDEAHERSIDTDITLYRMKLFIEAHHTNKDCPFLLVMSATFNPEKFADYMLSSVPEGRYESIIKVQGFTFPIEETWLEYDTSNYIQAAADVAARLHREHLDDIMDEDALRKWIREHQVTSKKLVLTEAALPDRVKAQKFRDILIFVSGEGDAKSIIRLLTSLNEKDPIFLEYPIIPIKLMGQDVTGHTENYVNITKPLGKINVYIKNKQHHPTRRIIVATNVAETGITIDSLKYVIDTGFTKSSEYNPSLRIGLLVTKPVTKSMYIQRRGRAGRKAPGFAFPLYTKQVYETLQDDQFPNIIKEDTCLDLLGLICVAADKEALMNSKSLASLYEAKPHPPSGASGGRSPPSGGLRPPEAPEAPEAPKKANIESAQSIRKRIRDQTARNLIKPSDTGLSEYALTLAASSIDVTKFDLIDPPSADSLSSSLDRLYTLGAINSNCTPTMLGVCMCKFRFVQIEAIKMILAGYAWQAPIQDLITLAAMLQVRSDIFGRDQGDLLEFMSSKDILMCSCDFINSLIIFKQYQKVCSDYMLVDEVPSGGKDVSNSSPEEWCDKHGLNYDFFTNVVSGREDIIRSMATMGLNPYAFHSKSLYIAPTHTGINREWIQLIKQCIFEGFKTNIATWNPISHRYETRNGRLQFPLDRPYISTTMDLISFGLQNPKYIIYDSMNYRQDFATNRYQPSIRYCTVLDGYIAIDTEFDT